MEELKKLLNRCKCGVFLTINEHRDYYLTAEASLKEDEERDGEKLEIPEDVRKVMIDTNTIIHLQFYPDTPIGSYEIYHHNIDCIMKEALEILGIE